MRQVPAEQVTETVERLFIEANYHLPPDMVSVLEKGEREEQNPVAKSVFRTILDNRRVASEGQVPSLPGLRDGRCFSRYGAGNGRDGRKS